MCQPLVGVVVIVPALGQAVARYVDEHVGAQGATEYA